LGSIADGGYRLGEVGSAGLKSAIGEDAPRSVDTKNAFVVIHANVSDDDVASCAIQEVSSRTIGAEGFTEESYSTSGAGRRGASCGVGESEIS
jgi:hypothetical protein